MNELHTTCYQVKIVGFIFSVLHKLEQCWTLNFESTRHSGE